MDYLLPLSILGLALLLGLARLLTRQRRSTPIDAPDQLRIVMRSRFDRQRLLSRAEFDLFRTIESHLPKCGPGYRLMAQASMGEILSSPDAEAFRCINSKRLDMLIIDTFGFPILAIEHQGSGHYQGDAPARDAVKREALRRAGLEYLEIFGHHDPAEVHQMVSAALRRSKPPISPTAIAR